MRANNDFKGLDKGFWAHVRSLSQTLGYTARSTGTIKVPTFAEILVGMTKLGLLCEHLVQNGKPTEFANRLIAYFAFRADILNNTVQHSLMDKGAAREMYERLLGVQKYKLAAAMNKQKGEKKQVAYLTAMVNMLIEANAEGISYDHDPRQLTYGDARRNAPSDSGASYRRSLSIDRESRRRVGDQRVLPHDHFRQSRS